MAKIIYVHGDFGYDFFAENVREDFENAVNDGEKHIIVDIESFGGDVYEGKKLIGMMNRAKNAGVTVETRCFSYAYSMGAYAFLSGTMGYRKMDEFADIMIHAAMGGQYGNADEMREAANELDQVTNNLLVSVFRSEKSKSQEEKISEYIKSETRIGAVEAIELGLADAMIEKLAAVAKFNPNKTKMNENKTLLDEVKALFTALIKPKAEEVTDDKDARIAELEAELAELKTAKETTETELETAKTEAVEAKAKVDEVVAKASELQTKFAELEAKVIGAGGNPEKEKQEEKPEPKPETMAQRMKRLDAENRKKYNTLN